MHKRFPHQYSFIPRACCLLVLLPAKKCEQRHNTVNQWCTIPISIPESESILESLCFLLESESEPEWNQWTSCWNRNRNHSFEFSWNRNRNRNRNQEIPGIVHHCSQHWVWWRGSAWGVPCFPLPSKFCPMLPAPQVIFIAHPQINFSCSLNHLCRLHAPHNFFHLLPEFTECSFNICERDRV